MNLGKLEGGQGITADWKLGDFPGSDQGKFQSHQPPLPHHCHRRGEILASRRVTATTAASFSCCQVKETDSPFSLHSAHTMGKGDQRQNYKCEPLMHRVEQWTLEASALLQEAVQLVLTTQCHGKKPHCPGKMLPRMKGPSSFFLQLPNGKQNNKLGPQLNKYTTNWAFLKCNRCCCSWTRLEAGSKPLWLAAAPGTLLLKGFLCHTTAFSFHQSFFLFLWYAFFLALLLVLVHPQLLYLITFHSSLHQFHFLALKTTGFISEKLKRWGKAMSINFLGHVSIGE